MAISDVFIIMPFGRQSVSIDGEDFVYPVEHFDDLYEILRDTVRAHNPSCRVDRMEQKHGNLVSAIIHRLYEADLVIAVLSGRNPNVFFELGVRHSLRRGTIMLVSDRREYPFDLTGYYSEQYSIKTGKERRKLEQFIEERLKDYDNAMVDDSPVLDVLQTTEREQWKALNNWEVRRATVVLVNVATELQNLNSWSLEWVNAISPAIKGGELGPLPVQRLARGVIASVAANAPLVGLPTNAYVDAINISAVTEHVQSRVLEIAPQLSSVSPEAQKRLLGELYAEFFELGRHILLFGDDVLTALEYVMQSKTAHSIPWADSLDDVSGVTVADANERGPLFKERWAALMGRAHDFQAEFSGAPPE
jgi:hypothetical protein